MKKYVTIIIVLMTFVVYGQNSPGQYTVKNAKINTQSSDFGTAFFGTDKVVFASPKQGFTLNREENTSQPFLDLYIGELTEDGQIVKKQKLKGDINSKYHEGMVSFTKDMKTVYFSANNFIKKKKNKEKNKSTEFLQLFKASVTEDGEWTNLILLPFNGTNFSSGHPVLNKDDNQLYFVSDRPESIGKTDLFVVDIYEDGSYSEPRNLGPQINTQDREMFPFIGIDNVLYFSSDGYPGHGELDVYASKIFDSTVSEPINLEEPVNSEYDDFAYIINDDKGRGYFSSNRAGGNGDDDIYSFIASPPIYIECMQEITGVVRDIETQNLVPDVKIILYDAKGLELQSFISSKEEGAFNFQQSCNTNYTIKGYLEGYLVGELDIKTVNDLNADPIEITLELMSDPNKEGEVIADLNTEGEAGKIHLETEDNTTAFSSKSEAENAHEEQKSELRVNTTEAKASSTQNAVAVGAVPVMKSVTETQSDDAIMATTPASTSASTPETITSVKKVDPAIESENSIAMDMSQDDKTSEDGIADFQSKGATTQIIQINTIYFDYDKDNIRPDAKIELEKIAVVLKENPETKIKVNSHTDVRGKKSYNLKLSNNRAYSTVQYLLNKGIDEARISSKGHGETHVAEKCTQVKPCTGLQHQLNRRSEFLIVDKFSDAIIAQSMNKNASGNYAVNDRVSNSGLYVNYDFSGNREMYTVQVGAFKGKVQTDKYSKLTDLFNYRYNDGLNRYYAGVFETSSEARVYMNQMRKQGFKDAFVVGLKGESRF